MSPLVTINVHPEYSEIISRSGENKITKIIDTANLGAIFKDRTESDTGNLNTIGDSYTAIKRIISRGNLHWVVVVSNNPLRNVTHRDSLYRSIYYPSVIFAVKLRENTNGKFDYQASKLATYEHLIINNDTNLYHFPFSNVWGDLRICWGGNNPTVVNNLGDAPALLESFFSLTMNNDLFKTANARPVNSNYDASTCPALLNSLSQKSAILKHFPYSDIKLKKVSSYGVFINSLTF